MQAPAIFFNNTYFFTIKFREQNSNNKATSNYKRARTSVLKKDMGKNKDRKKKGHGMEKTLAKTEKKQQKMLKKELEELGEVRREELFDLQKFKIYRLSS